MRQLTRRRFGQSLGASLALAIMTGAGKAADQAVVEVAIQRFKFAPGTVTIKPGQAVRWRNLDVAPHTATAPDGTWDTGRLNREAAQAITFAEPGTYPYFCAYHPHMKGVVRVEA